MTGTPARAEFSRSIGVVRATALVVGTIIGVRGHRDIAFRESVLDSEGIDMQVLTFTSPGTHIHARDRAVSFARMVDDTLTRIVRERSTRFTALATLPLNDPDASVAELERAIGSLGFRVALSDKRFWPVYEKASELGAVFYIHPIHPVGVEAMEDFWLMPLVGFPFDTTLAAASLVFSGVVERFPGITWVLAHLGGAIPYLAERLDRGFAAFRECPANISKLPSELAIEFAGAGHLLAESDYPHRIGSLRSTVESIGGLPIADDAKADILAGNASRLLGL